MNKKVTVENLEQLIEEHKKEKIPYKTYEFDSASYILLLCDINQLKIQLEEKDKLIDEVKKYCKFKTEFNCFGDNLTEKVLNTYISATKKDILKILERGKNND